MKKITKLGTRQKFNKNQSIHFQNLVKTKLKTIELFQILAVIQHQFKYLNTFSSKNLIQTNNITIDSKSGYSGAGKNLEKKFTHKNLYSSTFAYSTKNHNTFVKQNSSCLNILKKK